MVLKDKKSGAPKRTATTDNEGAFILSRLENPCASNILPSLRSYLEPVGKLQTSSVKENTDKHQIAKQFVPFLAQVLKLCSNGLSKLPSLDETDAKLRADELLLCVEFALDCFEHLRQWLVGSPFEIEMQRSWLVRRYIALRKFSEAFDQDLRLLCSLCSRIGTLDKPLPIRVEGCKKRNYNLKLPHPDNVKDLAESVVVLVIGAATDFVVCAAEIGLTEMPLLEKVIVMAQELEPWLRKLERDKEEKQRSLLFRELNKCVIAILSDSSHMRTELVEPLISLTLHQCALSSMRSHFCKVTRSICSRLSSQGPENAELTVKVCEEALSKIESLTNTQTRSQLEGVRGSYEILELVQCYARLCQAAKKNMTGWKHIQRAINKLIKDTPMIAVAGYYAVGLLLPSSSLDTSSPQTVTSETCSTLYIDGSLEQSVCKVLKDAIKVARKVLVCFSNSACLESANAGSEKSTMASKRESESLVSLYRALDFLRRPAFSYAQLQWDTFIAKHPDFYMPQELFDALRQCLLLFCELLNAGLGCGSLTPDESELFRKGSRSFFLAANAALKLSLPRQHGNKESVMLISNSLSAPFAGPEELKWLLSSSYNMGVQLFNMKLHDLACEPFRISYAASWERVLHSNGKWTSDALDPQSTEYINLVSDACTKSNILFDTLTRNNLSHEAVELFQESMVRWARTGLAGVKRHYPHPLLQLWLKKIFAMKSIKDRDNGENLMCSFILQCHPSLPADAIGLLLEEELSFYDNMEESDSSFTSKMKRDILDLLLDRVYTTDAFCLQQSRVLQEKGKLCRLDGVEGYNGCLSYVTQAIDILSKNIEGNDYYVLVHAKLQVAIGYFLRACCLQEIDPSNNDFVEDILNGLCICEDLFSSKPFDEQLLAQLPTGLLQNVADLLALKGYSSLQYRIYELQLDIASASHEDPEEAFARIFTDRKLSHLFCYSPFLYTLEDLVCRKLGLDLNSKALLQKLVGKYPNTLFSGFLCEVLNGDDHGDNLATSNWTEMSQTSDNNKSNESIFKASQAFFMLAECRRNKGYLELAVRNAKEALRLRLKLLNRSFKISSKTPLVIDSKVDPLEATHKVICFDALGPVAVRNWPDMNRIKKSEVGPSQWQIIGDYLESLMQVGVLSEMLGLVDDADSSFREGCQIAKAQNLPFAEGLFQSCLGETQRKRHLWEHAKSSYGIAKQLFDQCLRWSVCDHCMQLAGASLDIRIADLGRHQNLGNSMKSIQASKLTLDGYISAEKKLSCLLADLTKGGLISDGLTDLQHNVKNEDVCQKMEDLSLISISPVKDKKPSRNQSQYSAKSRASCLNKSLTCVEEKGFKQSRGRKVEKLCKLPEAPLASEVVNEHIISESGYRTRRKAAAKPRIGVVLPADTIEELCVEAHSKLNIQLPKIHTVEKSDLATKKGRKPTTRRKILSQDSVDGVNIECCGGLKEDRSAEEGSKPLEQFSQNLGSGKPCLLHKSGRAWEEQFSLQTWIDSHFILCGRRLSARIFLQKGKCLIGVASSHEVHVQFYRALGVLREVDWSVLESSCSSSLCGPKCLVTGASKHFGIEEGSLLYHISMLALRQETCKSLRDGCCFFQRVDVSTAAKWLCHAFLLCREMPLLLGKISRVIAILHVPMDLGGPFECWLEGFQSRRTAPYFHQLSLGAATRQQHLSTLDAKRIEKPKVPGILDAGEGIDKLQEALRVSSSTLNDLQSAIEEDIPVPCSTVCLSLVDREMRYLYGDLEDVPTESWLLVSRFDTDSGPFSILLPCAPLPNRFTASHCPYNLEVSDKASSALQSGTETAFENVSANFKSILDESRQSTSGGLSLNSLEEKSRWWEWRMDLDTRLASLLRGVEEMWLGPWKSLLLGKCSIKGSTACKSSAEAFKRQLESMTKEGPFNVDVIQILLQGSDSLSRGELERGIARLLEWRMCSQSTKGVQSKVAQDANSKLLCGGLVSSAVEAFAESFEAAVQKDLSTTSHSTEDFESYREPVVFVLDGHLQVLPWESLPVLRKKEVYRVPSLGSMNALTIQRYALEVLTSRQEKSGNGVITTVVPTMDPCNTYFLLNPSGDLGSTQAAFEDMFRCQQGWEGKVGQTPTIEEYMYGLQSHELFVYLGHGSGDQYLPERRMRKMDRCASALLMGCSSGRLSPRGDYEPVGVPLWYLMAGCPTAIANLWDVTDGDIDRFSRVLLQNWLESDSTQEKVTSNLSSQSNDPIPNHCQKGRRRGQKPGKSVKSSITPSSTTNANELNPRAARTASHIGEGRNTCRLPNLIGASPVCYGIPTLVRKKSSS